MNLRSLFPERMTSILITLVLLAASASMAAPFDVTAFGARGDGRTKDTAALQQAIEACASAGGGEVVLPKGTYLSGSLRLRSGVKLVVPTGARLLGSGNLADYPDGKLIYAVDERDIAIEGGGIIDGQGSLFWEKKPDAYVPKAPWHGTAQFQYRALKRPSFIHLRRCTNVVVRNVTLTNSPAWTVHFERCANVRASGLILRNPLHGPNTDGIDINSCVDVRIEDCDIITGDDGIVLKSTEPGRGHVSRSITVARCRIWSACNGLKIGTETHDDFQGIVFRDCHIYSASRNPLERTLAGVAIESVDGSHLSGILVSNLTMVNVKAPLFVRLGHRGGNSPRTRQVEPRVPGTIRNVLIQDVRATNAMFESSITGIPGHPVEGVTLSNVALHYEGGGAEELAEADVPDEEVKTRYPEAQMFGRLPAYGLYARHVRGLTLTGMHFAFATPDARSALVCDDVTGLRLRSVSAARSTGAQPILRFLNVAEAEVRECAAPEGTGVFLAAAVSPEARQSIILTNNDLARARQAIVFTQPGMDEESPLFMETAPGVFVIPCDRMKLSPPMKVIKDASVPPVTCIEVPEGEGRDRGRASCRIEVKTAGEYTLFVRALAPSGEQDSFYCAWDGGPSAISDVLIKGKWAWDRVHTRVEGRPVSTNIFTCRLSAGIHTLMIRNREAGTKLASVAVVLKGANFDPSRP